jgi:hypothetical protein
VTFKHRTEKDTRSSRCERRETRGSAVWPGVSTLLFGLA